MATEEKLNALEQRIARLERLIAAYGINEETAVEHEYKPLKIRKSDPDEWYTGDPTTQVNAILKAAALLKT